MSTSADASVDITCLGWTFRSITHWKMWYLYNTNTAYISDMVIYLKPIAAKFEENPSFGTGCIERTQ